MYQYNFPRSNEHSERESLSYPMSNYYYSLIQHQITELHIHGHELNANRLRASMEELGHKIREMVRLRSTEVYRDRESPIMRISLAPPRQDTSEMRFHPSNLAADLDAIRTQHPFDWEEEPIHNRSPARDFTPPRRLQQIQPSEVEPNTEKQIDFDEFKKLSIECIMCLEYVTKGESLTTECGHEYCATCWDKWTRINVKHSCPMCRKESPAIIRYKMIPEK